MAKGENVKRSLRASKNIVSNKVEASKPTKSIKKAERAKKANPAKAKNASNVDAQVLEVGLLMDCTGSMQSWLDRSK